MATYEIVSEETAREMYDDMLREVYGETTNLCGSVVDTVDTYKEMDPVAYRCGFSDYTDSLVDSNIFVVGYTDDQIPDEDENDGY